MRSICLFRLGNLTRSSYYYRSSAVLWPTGRSSPGLPEKGLPGHEVPVGVFGYGGFSGKYTGSGEIQEAPSH
jgi:hypothetical protein